MTIQDAVNRTYLPLAGGTMTGDITMSAHNIITPNIKAYTETFVTTASSGASHTIDLSTGNVFDITLTANCTFSFSNIPASNATSFTTILHQDATGSRVVTWPAAVTWASGSAPVLNTVGNSVDIFVFLTDTAGTVVYGFTTGTEAAAAYNLIQNNGTGLTKRSTLNFAATGLTAVDNSGSASTDVTLNSGISGWNGFNTNGILTQTASNTFTARTITGTATQIDVSNGTGVSGNPTISIDAGYSATITSLGTIATGVWNGTIIGATYGGTGVNNGSNTITLAGNLITSGANPLTLTTTGSTNVTLPTSGTLITSGVTSLPSLATVGTITSGTWNGTIITGTYGGTGVNNGASTITLGGNLTTSGANAVTFTTTGTTNVTLPTSGTLVNTGVTSLSSLATVGTVTSGNWESTLQDYTEITSSANSSTAYTINMANGNVQTITLTGNVTFSFSNVPASNCSSLTLIIVQGSGPYTITWPAAVIWPGGTAPTITTVNGHVDVFTMITTNGGTTWRSFTAGQNFSS